jgi:zinc transport system permease protein
MIESFFENLNNPFFYTALTAALLASLVSGVVGTFVTIKRLAFISGSISHAVLSGMGICLWLQRTQGIEYATPVVGALISALLFGVIFGWIHLRYKEREDSLIAALWAIGMAVGIIFISQTPGFNVELTSYLIGNLLWIRSADLWILGALDITTLCIIFAFYKHFLLICFDEEQAHLQGVPVNFFYLLLMVLISLSVVLLVNIVGVILVMMMLTIPPTIANLFTSRLSIMILLSVLIGALFSFIGIALAFTWNTPPGATIALISGSAYFLGQFLKSKK